MNTDNNGGQSTPCGSCPFRQAIGRGCDDPKYLGFNTVEEFVGQTFGPFRIPCHAHIDYSDPDWKDKASTTGPECVGNAALRNKSGLYPILPKPLLRTDDEAAKQTTFDSVYAFYAHHAGISTEEAVRKLSTGSIYRMVQAAMNKADVKVMAADELGKPGL